jgi:hypothetical protein
MLDLVSRTTILDITNTLQREVRESIEKSSLFLLSTDIFLGIEGSNGSSFATSPTAMRLTKLAHFLSP